MKQSSCASRLRSSSGCRCTSLCLFGRPKSRKAAVVRRALLEKTFKACATSCLKILRERTWSNLLSEKRHRSFKRPSGYLSAHVKKGGRVYKVESSVAPVSPLPRSNILAFRRQALDKFARQHTSQEPSRKTDAHAENLVSSKDLDPRERNTLLVIIAALAKKAKLDISQPFKAGKEIELFTVDLDARVADRTIGEVFKKVPDALAEKHK